jgi:hypothetical protein
MKINHVPVPHEMYTGRRRSGGDGRFERSGDPDSPNRLCGSLPVYAQLI